MACPVVTGCRLPSGRYDPAVEHVVEVADRTRFKACRRAWDLGATRRRNLEPVEPAPGTTLEAALRAGLAAYYYPAMWAWNRELVRPIAVQSFTKALAGAAAAPDDEDRGLRALADYFAWAPGEDASLTALRVGDEVNVVVPDPDRSGAGLPGPDGGGIRMHGVLDVLAGDDHGRLWVIEHRITGLAPPSPPEAPRWCDPEVLRLDDRAGALCWAAGLAHDATVAGVLFNEIWVGPRPAFRRTRVRVPPRELAQLRRQAAGELGAMLDPGIPVYPTPSPQTCGACAFRGPCEAIQEGADPTALLAAGFRRRAPAVIPLPERTGSLGPQRVVGWKTRGPGTSSLDTIPDP